MPRDSSWEIEPGRHGARMVVTGGWSAQAADELQTGAIHELWLNYARGFSEENLDFIEDWPIRSLLVISRQIDDLSPIERIGAIEELSIQASPAGRLDLTRFPGLRRLFAFWPTIEDSLVQADVLEDVSIAECPVERFSDIHLPEDVRAVELKDAPLLATLDGVERLAKLRTLKVALAPRLIDIGAVANLASLHTLQFDACPGINALDPVSRLDNLAFLEVGDCRDIESLRPLRSLRSLHTLYAWGTTRVLDDDLRPIAELPRLKELRMQDRRSYQPRVRDLVDENAQRRT